MPQQIEGEERTRKPLIYVLKGSWLQFTAKKSSSISPQLLECLDQHAHNGRVSAVKAVRRD